MLGMDILNVILVFLSLAKDLYKSINNMSSSMKMARLTEAFSSSQSFWWWKIEFEVTDGGGDANFMSIEKSVVVLVVEEVEGERGIEVIV